MLSKLKVLSNAAERLVSCYIVSPASLSSLCTQSGRALAEAAGCSRQRGISWRPPFALSASQYSTAAAAIDSNAGLLIHPSAATRLRELQAEKPGSTVVLRIEVEGGGCSGFQYRFKLDDAVRDDDLVFEQDGGRVVCDTLSLEFLRGATLEFEDTLMRAAFTISKNPNAEASCGCGSSFAAKLK